MSLILKHLVEVDVPGAIETIAELFDDAIDLLPSCAIVYGGAIRDLTAGLPIVGDLDVAVPETLYDTVVRDFQVATKWYQIENDPNMIDALKKVPENKKLILEEEGLHTAPGFISSLSTKKDKDLFFESSSPPPPSHFRLRSSINKPKKLVREMSTFSTFNKRKIQIISSKSLGEDMEDSIFVTRFIDIVCCGMIMTTEGSVYEVIPGAYQDCFDKVLRLNLLEGNCINFERTFAHIKKLEARGWTSKIETKQLKIFVQKQNAKLKRIEKAKEQKQLKRAGLLNKNSFFIEQTVIDTLGAAVVRSEIRGRAQRMGLPTSKFLIIENDKGFKVKSKNVRLDHLIKYKERVDAYLMSKVSKKRSQTLKKHKKPVTHSSGDFILDSIDFMEKAALESAFIKTSPAKAAVIKNPNSETKHLSHWEVDSTPKKKKKITYSGTAQTLIVTLISRDSDYNLHFRLNYKNSSSNPVHQYDLTFPPNVSMGQMRNRLIQQARTLIQTTPRLPNQNKPKEIILVLEGAAKSAVGTSKIRTTLDPTPSTFATIAGRTSADIVNPAALNDESSPIYGTMEGVGISTTEIRMKKGIWEDWETNKGPLKKKAKPS